METKSSLIYQMMQFTEEMHIEDPRRMIVLDEVAELLMKDKVWAFQFLEKDTNYEMIDWLCGTFVELSWHFGSQEFLAIVKGFLLKYPDDSRLAYFVGIAEENTIDKIIVLKEIFTARLQSRISRFAELSRPLLLREKYERDALGQILAANTAGDLYAIREQIDAQPTDADLKKQLLAILDEKQEFHKG